MSTPTYGFAIVGTGMIAGFHAQAIGQTAGARLVGVVSRSPERGRAFAAQHGIAAVTPDVATMAARPEVDVVCVTTPSGAHLDSALAAIRAGKHVIIEKPLEITPARADQIIAAADEAGVKVAAIFQGRFGAGAQLAKSAIVAGRLGRLVLASVNVKWHRSAEYYRTAWKGTWALDGGGALMNQAIHGVDLLQWLAGMPDEVSGQFARRVHTAIEADDTAVAQLHFPDGALGTIEATTAAWPGWARRIELCGESGSICLEDDHVARWDFAQAEAGDDAIRQRPREQALGSGAGTPGGISLAGHCRQIADLVAAIREDRAPLVDAREGRKAVALVHALYESAKSGRPIRLQ